MGGRRLRGRRRVGLTAAEADEGDEGRDEREGRDEHSRATQQVEGEGARRAHGGGQRLGERAAGGRGGLDEGEAAQGVADRCGGGGALAGGRVQERGDDLVERLGDLAAELLLQGGGRRAELAGDQLGDALALPQAATDAALPEDHAEGVEIAAGVDGVADGLLGGHVAGGAEDRPHAGEGQALVGDGGGLLDDASDAEVDDAGVQAAVVAGLDEDVVGLEVAMDDADRVGGGEGVGDLRAEVGDGARAELAVGVEVLGEADAADQLDHEVGAAVGELAGVDRAGDVRVIDAGGGDGLALEAGAGLGVARELGADDLDRDLLAQLEVLGDVDGAHATFTEQLDDAVAAVDDLADAAESGERTVAGRVRVGDTEVFCDRGVPRDLAARWHGGAVYPREPGARLSERSDLAGALARAARAGRRARGAAKRLRTGRGSAGRGLVRGTAGRRRRGRSGRTPSPRSRRSRARGCRRGR